MPSILSFNQSSITSHFECISFQFLFLTYSLCFTLTLGNNPHICFLSSTFVMLFSSHFSVNTLFPCYMLLSAHYMAFVKNAFRYISQVTDSSKSLKLSCLITLVCSYTFLLTYSPSSLLSALFSSYLFTFCTPTSFPCY